MRALVIEGGGMRASYSNGVLAALEDAGQLRVDAVYGTSAGGAIAAWWTAGQARFALKTWDYVRDPRIMSWPRFLLGRGPLLDHDALFRLVYAKEHPLDTVAVHGAPHPVYVTVTDAATGTVHYVDLRQGRVLDWLRATGRLPLAAGPAVELDGRKWLDGGLADPIPIQRAIQDGATEILAVLNTPPGQRGPESRLATRLVRRQYPAVAALAARHHELHDGAVTLAEDPPEGVTVHLIRPDRRLNVGRLSRNLTRIRAAIGQGERHGRAFADEHPEWFAAGPTRESRILGPSA